MNQQEKVWDKLYKSNKTLWSKETSTLSNLLKNKNVLEIGVGNGKTLLSILKQKPKSITAIDISQVSIEICKSLFKNKNIIFKKDNIIKSKLKSSSFDISICYYVLNNLKENEKKKAISEMYRLLSNKGIILFEDFAVNDFRQKEGKVTKEVNTIIKSSGLIHHFFTKDELTDLFSKFNSIKVKEKSFSPFRNKKHLKRKLISAIINKN